MLPLSRVDGGTLSPAAAQTFSNPQSSSSSRIADCFGSLSNQCGGAPTVCFSFPVRRLKLSLWTVADRSGEQPHWTASMDSTTHLSYQQRGNFFSTAQENQSLEKLRAHSTGGREGEEGAEEAAEAERLSAEFMRFINENQKREEMRRLLPMDQRKPSHLMAPTAVVQLQMDALMRNDWPDDDSGIRTAFNFALPLDALHLLPGQVAGPVRAVRAWEATERYVTMEEFSRLLREPMYAPLINCLHWSFTSPMTFHGPGDNRAVQAVQVRSPAADGGDSQERELNYTFCLQKVPEGPFKGCWMVVGLRLGDYANV